MWSTVPVLDEHGNVQLYDMYVGGKWHGSRRTTAQCEMYFNQLK